MRKILYSASLFTFLIFLFTGCGSDGSSSSPADTNGGADTTAPEYVSSVVEDSNKNKVFAAFSENITSSGSGFSISIDGVPAVVSSMSGTGTAVLTFTLAADVAFGNVVTIAYDADTGDAADTASAPNPLASFNKTVSNNVADPGDITDPVVTAAVQNVSNTTGESVEVTSNETGKVYIILDGELQVTVDDFNAAVAANKGRTANVVTPDVAVTLSTENLLDGTYYAYAVDAAGNISDKGTNAITVTDGILPVLSSVTAGPLNIGDDVSTTSTEDGNIYLVPSGTTADVASLDAAAGTSNGIKVAATADTPVTLSSTGFSAGVYKVYAVDGFGNISAPSAEITIGALWGSAVWGTSLWNP